MMPSASTGFPRITSYNVCYTKLLRHDDPITIAVETYTQVRFVSTDSGLQGLWRGGTDVVIDVEAVRIGTDRLHVGAELVRITSYNVCYTKLLRRRRLRRHDALVLGAACSEISQPQAR